MELTKFCIEMYKITYAYTCYFFHTGSKKCLKSVQLSLDMVFVCHKIKKICAILINSVPSYSVQTVWKSDLY